MKVCKTLFLALVLIFASTGIYAQDTDTETVSETYFEVEYELLLDDYEELLGDYKAIILKLKELNYTYEKEIDEHEKAKEQIKIDQLEISGLRDNLEDLIYVTDPRYFSAYVIGGYMGESPLAELALTVDIPKTPFSVYAGTEYIHFKGVNMKLGIGFKF